MRIASLVFYFSGRLDFFFTGLLFVLLALAFRRVLVLLTLLHFGTGLSGYIRAGEASIEGFPEFFQEHLCFILSVLFTAGMVDLICYLSQLNAILGDFFFAFIFDEFLGAKFLGDVAVYRQRQRLILLEGLLAILIVLIRVLPLGCVAGVHIDLV